MIEKLHFWIFFYKTSFFFLGNVVKKVKTSLRSPDSSENPLWAGVQPTKIEADSGMIFPENAQSFCSKK